eukprot:g23343.t1
MGLASLPWTIPSSWTILCHLSFVEKFAKKNTFDRKSIKYLITRAFQQAPRHLLADGEKGTTRDSLHVRPEQKQKLLEKFSRMHTETSINCIWRTINSVKDALWFFPRVGWGQLSRDTDS